MIARISHNNWWKRLLWADWLTDWLTLFIHSRTPLFRTSYSRLCHATGATRCDFSVEFRGFGSLVCRSVRLIFLVLYLREWKWKWQWEWNPCRRRHTSPLNEYIFISEMWACSSFKSKCVVYQGSSINWLFITIYYIYALQIVSANIVSLSTLPRNLLKSHLHLITLQTYSTCIIINNTCRIV